MKKGDKVRIERDETKHPTKGTWSRFAGKTGRITSVNPSRMVDTMVWANKEKTKTMPAKVRIEAEYGIAFNRGERVDAWFRVHELVRL